MNFKCTVHKQMHLCSSEVVDCQLIKVSQATTDIAMHILMIGKKFHSVQFWSLIPI